jgi:hypothetical protein
MSTTVRSYGFMALLATPITDPDEREEISERLWEAHSTLGINGEGTLVYSDQNANADMRTREDIYGLNLGKDASTGSVSDFANAVHAAELEIDLTTVQPYSCIWYNGSDSDMDTLTKAQFMQRTGLA